MALQRTPKHYFQQQHSNSKDSEPQHNNGIFHKLKINNKQKYTLYDKRVYFLTLFVNKNRLFTLFMIFDIFYSVKR